MNAQELAVLFHDTYERLAPDFGYETRPDTKRFDPTTPNGRLMIAVCGVVLETLAAPPQPESVHLTPKRVRDALAQPEREGLAAELIAWAADSEQVSSGVVSDGGTRAKRQMCNICLASAWAQDKLNHKPDCLHVRAQAAAPAPVAETESETK